MKVVLGFVAAVFLFAVLFFYLHHVGSSPAHRGTAPNALYRKWMETTAETAAEPEPGTAQEQEWVDSVKTAFSPFTVENVKKHFPDTYAEEMYFRDAFHTYTDRDAMVDYMVASAEMSPGVTFEFSPAVRDGIDFYLPWVMVLPGKDGEKAQKSLGMTHLRFDAQGQVIFHQDYWDSADVLVPAVPVANGLIELVRQRF